MVSVSGRSRSRLRKRESGGPEEGYEKKKQKRKLYRRMGAEGRSKERERRGGGKDVTIELIVGLRRTEGLVRVSVYG